MLPFSKRRHWTTRIQESLYCTFGFHWGYISMTEDKEEVDETNYSNNESDDESQYFS